MTHGVGIVEIDRDQTGQREIALAILGRADFAFDRVAGAQAEFADLIGRDVDVVGAGEIVGLRAAQEAEAIGEHLDRALTHDQFAILSLSLEDREHQILLTQRRSALDAEFLGHRHQFGGRGFLQFFKMHGRGVRLEIRVMISDVWTRGGG